jgi:hypothetical protein
MNVSGFTTLNNNVTLLSSLNVFGHSTLRSITSNKNNVDPSDDSLIFGIIHRVHIMEPEEVIMELFHIMEVS